MEVQDTNTVAYWQVIRATALLRVGKQGYHRQGVKKAGLVGLPCNSLKQTAISVPNTYLFEVSNAQ